jgi:hypothetical protein
VDAADPCTSSTELLLDAPPTARLGPQQRDVGQAVTAQRQRL